MCSRSMYCQTSSSVQLESGKTRMCSPAAWRPLYRLHSSGRWRRGSQPPDSSRSEKIRSLARAFSSSRRPPPKTASKRLVSMASSSGTVCSGLRLPSGRSRRTPRSMKSWTLATCRRSLGDDAVAVGDDFGEVVAGVDVQQGEGDGGGPEGAEGEVEHDDGVLAAREKDHRALQLPGDLTEDVHRLGLKRVQVGQCELGAVGVHQTVGHGGQTSPLSVRKAFSSAVETRARQPGRPHGDTTPRISVCGHSSPAHHAACTRIGRRCAPERRPESHRTSTTASIRRGGSPAAPTATPPARGATHCNISLDATRRDTLRANV